MDWICGAREGEKSGMIWKVELPFTEMGTPVGASVLVGWNIRNLAWVDVKCEMSVRHPRGDVK